MSITVHEKINKRGHTELTRAFFNPRDKHNTRRTRGEKKNWNNKLLKHK
jgi:hypothetical protein